jgi:hypothetical protein
MPVDQDIQKFYNIAIGRDFSRDFLFRVTSLQLPGIPALTDDELIYAKAAALPGRNIGNVAVPYMGLNFNIPGSVEYPGSDGYSLEFYLDANTRLRTFFERASRVMFDDQSSTGAYGTPGSDSYITLAQLDKKLEPLSVYKLVGASIRNIENIEYNMSAGKGETVTVSTTIAYHYYETL